MLPMGMGTNAILVDDIQAVQQYTLIISNNLLAKGDNFHDVKYGGVREIIRFLFDTNHLLLLEEKVFTGKECSAKEDGFHENCKQTNDHRSLMVCGCCKSAVYCCECQASDWPSHRGHCNKVATI